MIIEVMIEIPKGSKNKYEYNKETQQMWLDRVIFSPARYPADYGFITNTLGEDGDPLDAMVLIDEPTFPGCMMHAKPVAVLNMSDEKGTDQKILCVPAHDPFMAHITQLSDVPQSYLKEIENFFAIYKTLEQKMTKIDGWQDEKAAVQIILEAQKRNKPA